MQKIFSLPLPKTACSNCNLREWCLPMDITAGEMAQLEDLTRMKRTYRRGDYLYRSGSPLQSLYAIRTGFFKTQVLHENGREQVTGFQMAGEIIGMDAISNNSHTCNAVALEDSEVCELPFGKLEELGRKLPMLQRHLHRILSREIVRDHGIMLLLGSMRAEERLAAFLLNLSHRFAARGYSPSAFQLRMTRQEIGNYLGMKLETVSRTLSQFQQAGLISVRNKAVEILDAKNLRSFFGYAASSL
ncbi:MAG TPA: fumarate/nitrate reduction transcriptional regulator Fnr [Gallionellaceae bacterium]|nr:fumarate/nitrate reduction transcriptional regulator Fnr [Gallionellaceae bacterium]